MLNSLSNSLKSKDQGLKTNKKDNDVIENKRKIQDMAKELTTAQVDVMQTEDSEYVRLVSLIINEQTKA